MTKPVKGIESPVIDFTKHQQQNYKDKTESLAQCLHSSETKHKAVDGEIRGSIPRMVMSFMKEFIPGIDGEGEKDEGESDDYDDDEEEKEEEEEESFDEGGGILQP